MISQPAVAQKSVAQIALPVPLHQLFDYKIPSEMLGKLEIGMRVRVPFGRSQHIGCCMGLQETSEFPKLRAIQQILDDEAILDEHLLKLIQWTSSYYLSPIGEVIQAAIPSAVRNHQIPVKRWVVLQDVEKAAEGRQAETRIAIARHIEQQGGCLQLKELLQINNPQEKPLATSGRLKTLEKYGAIRFEDLPQGQRPSLSNENPSQQEVKQTEKKSQEHTPVFEKALALNQDQASAVQSIVHSLNEEEYKCFLLMGVTGSGKTEVYLQAIAHCLSQGKSALVLLPEIALTPQTLSRFEKRFGEVAVLHSMLAAGKRAQAYHALRKGELKIAIGARSAIFAPLKNLGLIVVDESHESSYKQESNPRYHARDLAVLRASLLKIPCVLGSATPCYESLYNAESNRYELLRLPERVTKQDLATIELVDRSKEKPNSKGNLPLISDRLKRLIRETLDRNQQVLLFLNRRGFARNVNCKACGFNLQCPHCDIGLTYHKFDHSAQCHYCGLRKNIPQNCPDCKQPGLKQSHAGTEKIEEILALLYPDAVIGRMDRDSANTRNKMEDILQRFREGKIQILVGTQMIAKGHDIPNVTLVGVLDADLALSLPDFRAAERTAQLICQVSGRAGRGEIAGHVIIQTRKADHYAIQASKNQDLSLLIEEEKLPRRALSYPPFGYLVRVLIEDPDEERGLASSQAIADHLVKNAPPAINILGPAPAPLSRLRANYRHHILVKSKERKSLFQIAPVLRSLKAKWSSSRIIVDVDPQSLL